MYVCATLMPKRGSCGSALSGCCLSKRYPSINSLAVHCCTSRACRDAHCSIFGSPLCRHCTSPRALVRLPSRAAPALNPQRPLLSRCPTFRDFVPWRFLDAGQLSARVFHRCRRPKTSTQGDETPRHKLIDPPPVFSLPLRGLVYQGKFTAYYSRASSTILNGVSVARRTVLNPPDVIISRNFFSPAWAPSPAPTSWASEVGKQIMVEPA